MVKSKSYFEKSLELENRVKILGETEVLRMVSDDIRRELANETYIKFLRKNLLLKIFSEKMLLELVGKLNRRVFGPGEEIAKVESI